MPQKFVVPIKEPKEEEEEEEALLSSPKQTVHSIKHLRAHTLYFPEMYGN